MPPLVISQETTHKMDREEAQSSQPQSLDSTPRSGTGLSQSTPVAHGAPRRAVSAALHTDAPAADSPKTPAKRTPITRSLTMSASTSGQVPLLDQLNQKFARAITDLPVASDIPRMSPRTTVYDVQTGSVLFNRAEGVVGASKPVNTINLVKVFITFLFHTFFPENKRLATIASEKFDEVLPTDYEGDTRDRLNSFLGANVTDGPVAAVLKCMNQGLVAPAIMALRISLMGKVTYKDCGPNWDVEVRTNTASVIVIHQKREQTVPAGAEFVWRLEMHIATPFTQLLHVEFNIVDLVFMDDKMDAEKKAKLIDALSGFMNEALREQYATQSPSKQAKADSPDHIHNASQPAKSSPRGSPRSTVEAAPQGAASSSPHIRIPTAP